MAILKNPAAFPAIANWMDDFWNTDKLFNDHFFAKELFPAVNVKEKDDSFEIEMTAPGLKKEDFKIQIENGVLNISSETRREEEEKNEKFTRKEFNYSSFSRSFSLPENVTEEDLAAKYENGLLKIKLAKKQVEMPKKKQIEVA